MENDIKARIWVAIDKWLDHDGEDAAAGVELQDRLEGAESLLRTIAGWCE